MEHETMLECRDAATGAMRSSQYLFTKEGASLSQGVLARFVRRCIAYPNAPQQPALPALMLFSNQFSLHMSAVEPFLNSLPAPFKWKIDGPDGPEPARRLRGQYEQPDVFDVLVGLAGERKDTGNKEYALRNHECAVRAYTQGIEALCRAFASAPERILPPFRRLRAVLLANRAAVHLLDHCAEEALRDGRAAEEADPTYVKGYFRQVRAHEMLGETGERRAVLERALGFVYGADLLAVKSALRLDTWEGV
ncbi:hypothetical protein FA95DRAFT_991445 [Auriscalpium vulgare]|uniref:Uncharacterized protein n=1 Tax=Auriscalpium vulgare TaxID=40419 RepID=A0ACB8R6H7_9AGAM|nr:hypothetical protein FA95DRAFT_991445 [Auriscalpium vulgare]